MYAEGKVLYSVRLDDHHTPSGFTKHTYKLERLPTPYQLKIVQLYDGILLIHFDEFNNELTDTLHGDVDDAMKQAELEFCVQREEWVS